MPRLLRRAIRNLLENARRYGASRRCAVGGARRPATRVIDVMRPRARRAAAERERIFEPFYRLPGASERDGGVGLGLAWCARSPSATAAGARRAARGGGGAFGIALPRG